MTTRSRTRANGIRALALLTSTLGAISERRAIRRTIRELEVLDDLLLSDMGLDRNKIALLRRKWK